MSDDKPASHTEDDNTSSSLSGVTRARRRLDEAASRAAKMVNEYVDVEDPYSKSKDNPWSDVDHMVEQLQNTRNELMTAWYDYKEEFEKEQANDEDEVAMENETIDDDFRAQYMDMVTEAFADVLEGMREEGGDIDVDVLADCLESGMDLLTAADRKDFFASLDNEFSDDEAGDDSKLPIHERRRKEMGFKVPISS